ncbi:glycosyltransferase family 39 protein [[Clostridium] aminophilum]|uniref:glycosyltransferase family 39 protein n=1 Tax=[Clostridium] aminophilum TaxID=1526 RepID=UPI003F9A758D
MILISLAAFVLRYMFHDVISSDMRMCLLPWYETIAGMDLRTALTTQVGNYNFLYQLLIYILTLLPGEAMMKYKMLSVLFDFLLAGGVWLFLRDIYGQRKAIAGYAAVLFLPTVWLNSAAWGQCDSMYAAMIIWAMYFLHRNRIGTSFAFLGVAFAFKLQTIFIIPFYGFLFLDGLIQKKGKIRIYHFLIIPAAMIATVIPNLFCGRPVWDMISVYSSQTVEYDSITKNYPSVWNLWKLSYHADKWWCIGVTALILMGLLYWFCLKKADMRKNHFLWCAFLLTYTCVLFLPAMHERYGFLYEIIAVLLAFCTGCGWIIASSVQLVSMKTYFAYLYGTPQNMELLSICNLAIYLFSIYAFHREMEGRPVEMEIFRREENMEGGTDRIRSASTMVISSLDRKAMAALTFLFLVFGSMHLGQMKAPVTAAQVGKETEAGTDVLVSLRQKQKVHSICIYSKMAPKDPITVYYAKEGKWEPIGKDLTLGGVFTWKEIVADVETHQFCVIFPAGKDEIAEIACMDEEGKRIPLIPSGTPKELFDEQECIPEIPDGFYSMTFDEVYHGRTAYEFLHGMPIYENTHPPLGKSIISVGIAIFGMNPFGYRIASLIFGALCIPVMYLIALRICGRSDYAVLGTVLQITEFMHYTLSRIATIDIFVAFFVICLFYGLIAFLQEERLRYLVMSGVAFALGVATKWTALYTVPAVAVILLGWMAVRMQMRERSVAPFRWGDPLRGAGPFRFIGICLACFAAAPALVYALSYIPFARVYEGQNIFQHAVSNSIHMLYYHEGALKPHPYSSPWYTWLFDWIPLVDFRTSFQGVKSSISTFVNPLVCYAGLAAVAHHIYLAYKKNMTAVVLLIFYLAMLLPWAVIARTVFIYQYFICTKILIVMILHSIRNLGFVKEKKVLCLTGGLSAVFFILYFPVISGVAASELYINEILKILPMWKF